MVPGARITPALIVLALYGQILLFGGNRTDLALAFSGLWFLALALLAMRPWARAALEDARLGSIGVCFAGVLAVIVLSLTPWAIGGPNPLWTWVHGARAMASIDPFATVVEILKLMALAAIFLIGLLIGADDDRAKSCLRWFLRLGLVYSLWAFYDRVTNPFWLFGAPRAFDPHRLSASLGSANTASVMFGALILLNLVDLDRRRQKHPLGRAFTLRNLEPLLSDIALPMLGLASAGTCLVLTMSRSGLLATAAISVTMVAGALAARARRDRMSAPVLAAATLVAGLVLISLALNFDALQARLSFLPGDALARRTIFTAHWGAFISAPLSGYGLGAFERVNAMIMNQSNVTALETLGAAHNVYLQWLEQAGVIGAALMFLCFGLITLRVARGALRRRRMRSWLVGILAVITLFLAQGASDYALEVPAMAALLSLLMGLGCAIAGAPGRARRA